MKHLQLSPADRALLAQAMADATARAASALAQLVGAPVEAGHTRVRTGNLQDAVSLTDAVPASATVIYLQAVGDIAGQLLLVMPAASATALAHRLLGVVPAAVDAETRRDTLGEVGNIALTSFLNELARQGGLAAEPTTPLVAMDASAAVLELPLARAAGDDDAVLTVDTVMTIDTSGSGPLRAPFQLVFLPAPGSLSRLLGARLEQGRPVRVGVRMGELAVSNRPGDVLVAGGLGSCVAVALVDRRAGVAGVAHVMLPEAPRQAGRVAGRPVYAARYADTAVPALVQALERAGGSRRDARAWIAGGSQMFRGALAGTIDVNDRNVAAVVSALRALGIRIADSDLGGASSRELEVDVATLGVSVRVDAAPARRLRAA